MGNLSTTVKFIWSSLRPILFIFFIFIVLAVTLIAYDQYKSYQDQQKGADLVNRIIVTPTCDEIVKSGEKITFELKIKNVNIESVILENIQITNNLFETEKNKVVDSIVVTPNAVKEISENTSFAQYNFQPPIGIPAKKSIVIKVAFKTVSTRKAGAKPHTIMVYNGDLNLLFDHEIKIRSSCRYQVRYN